MTRARTNADNVTADIAGITAGTGITGGGTSGTVTITNSMATAFDTKGDLIGATGADTFSKLAVGANGTVLTAASGEATGLSWATPSSGGMTLLSTTTLSGTSTTISGINQTYNSLFLIVSGVTSSGINRGLNIRPNNSTTNCSYAGVRRITNVSANTNGSEDSDIELAFNTETDKTSAANAWAVTFHNYASTTSKKPFHFYGEWYNAGSNSSNFAGAYTANTAITSLVFRYGGDTMTGGTVLLYGVK